MVIRLVKRLSSVAEAAFGCVRQMPAELASLVIVDAVLCGRRGCGQVLIGG
jgi:hypothetical protein